MDCTKNDLKSITHLWKSKTLALFCGAIVTTFLMVGSSFAQETGQISGTVTDPTGAVVPGVVLSAKNVATNAVRTATANSSGSFVFTNMPPAIYEITSQVTGFAPYKTELEVPVGGHVTLEEKLSVTNTSQSVDVSDLGGAQVNIQTQELSQVVDRQQVSQLPSLTRNPYDFIALSGNVSSGDNSEGNKTQNTTQNRGTGYSLNGQRSSGTEILLDGVENLGVFNDTVGITVPIDAVQEFSVITSNFQPQYGRASGGVVNVATRSGTNAFHGNIWEFNRLAAYTANTVTNAQEGNPKGQYTRNQFGFAVGGPILKDKLFFFGSTEWTRVRSSAAAVAAVPTAQFLALAAPSVQSYFQTYGANQNFNVLSTTTNQQIAANNNNNAIANIPLPTPVFQTVGYNAPGDAGGGAPQNTYNIVGRVDYTLSDKTQLFFRYVDYSELDQSGSQFASPYAAYNVGQSIKNQAYLLSAAHEFNPNLTSITKLSFSRFNATLTYDTSLQNVPTLAVAANASLPGTSTQIQLPGFYDQSPATLGGLPFGGPQNTVQINQDLNFVKGKHTAQFGAQLLYIQENNAFGASGQAAEILGKDLPTGLQNLQSGSLFQFSVAVNPQGALPCAANQYTGALAQTPACSIDLPATSPDFARSDRFRDWAVYAQDAWKATPRTTINYGVRYEYYGVQHNNNPNLDSNFYFGPGDSIPAQIRSGQVLTAPNSPIHSLWKPQYGTVSPRIGFAYDVFGNGKTSVRGGYGISYERNFGNVTFNLIQNPPNYAVIVETNSSQVTNSNLGPLSAATGNVALPPTSLRQVDPNIRTSQTQFWSGAIEQQLTPGTVLSLQYTGSRGLHLYDIKTYNGLGSGNALLGDPILDPGGSGVENLTRLNPQYANINSRGSNGDSYYEGLNVGLDSRNLYHTGIRFVANYTLSHETDDLSTTFSETNTSFSLGYTNPFNPSFDHGNGDFDIRHRLVLAPIYKTPTFASSSRGLKNESLGGWQVTGIYTVRTGTPFSFYDTTDNASGNNVARYTPADGIVPQHTFKSVPTGVTGQGSNSYVLGTLSPANPQPNPAFAVNNATNPNLPISPTNPANPNLPNFPNGITDWGPFPADITARNSFRGPGAWSFDASVSKIFPIREQLNIEFRAEAFDLLNHHNLYIQEAQNNAASTLQILASKGGVGAGTPAGANDERRFGQFALKVNF